METSRKYQDTFELHMIITLKLKLNDTKGEKNEENNDYEEC